MALVLADRVKETATSPGTGAVTLLGASLGFQSFAVIGNGNTTYYTISDQGGPNWEVGIGTYSTTGPTLTRTVVLASSNSGSLTDFNAGTQDVFVTYPSEKATYLNASNNVSALGIVSSGTWNATPVTTTYGGTGLSSYTAGDLTYYTSGTTLSTLAIGTNGKVLTSNGSVPTWGDASSIAVTTFSAGSTGFTPSSPTAGAVTLAGTLATTNGGTGLTSFTSGGVLYASSTSALTTGSSLTYSSSTLSAPYLNASSGFIVNNQTIGTSYAIPSGSSAMSTGPVTVSGGVTVTVPAGSKWVVL